MRINMDYKLDPPDPCGCRFYCDCDEVEQTASPCPCEGEYADAFTPCDTHNPLPAFDQAACLRAVAEADAEYDGDHAPVIIAKHDTPEKNWALLGFVWFDALLGGGDRGPFPTRQAAYDDWLQTLTGRPAEPDPAYLLSQLERVDLATLTYASPQNRGMLANLLTGERRRGGLVLGGARK